mgnify:CR=1 FL=1
MRLFKCNTCGKVRVFDWDSGHLSYGSLALEELDLDILLYFDSRECADKGEMKLESGEWKLPRVASTHGGYNSRISKPQKGYKRQPSQVELKMIINKERSAG